MMAHRSCFIDMIVIYVFCISCQLGDRKIKYHPLCSLYKEWRVILAPWMSFTYCPLLDFSSLPSDNCCTISKKEYWEERMCHQVTWRTPLQPVTQLQIARIAEHRTSNIDFRRVSDRLNRCIESTSACFESPHKETIVNGYIYFSPAWRNIAWPDVLPYSLSRNCKLHASPNKCRFQMRSCMENCAISRKVPYIFQKLFHPAQKRRKH